MIISVLLCTIYTLSINIPMININISKMRDTFNGEEDFSRANRNMLEN